MLAQGQAHGRALGVLGREQELGLCIKLQNISHGCSEATPKGLRALPNPLLTFRLTHGKSQQTSLPEFHSLASEHVQTLT